MFCSKNKNPNISLKLFILFFKNYCQKKNITVEMLMDGHFSEDADGR